MKIFDVLLILILVSIIALAVEASTNEGTKDVSAIESKEGERDSLRSATPKPTGQPKKKKENENKWLKSLNNLSRNTGKDSSKQFEKIETSCPDRDEKDDGIIPNIFTGVGKTVSGALDSFLGIFTGRSRDDDHN
ncbi:unnamed protein product [Allacma fusca]|uniref:Uncharacterized protein n=1 Tax=Allacma fusca TaxID=39272 RepID=A0A8J2JYA8_9HEXA|nr:unnamed protein product [Allacma fusca]